MNIPHLCASKKVTSLSAIVIDNNVVVSVESVTLVPRRGPALVAALLTCCCFDVSRQLMEMHAGQREAAAWQRRIKIFLTHKSNQMPIFLHLA